MHWLLVCFFRLGIRTLITLSILRTSSLLYCHIHVYALQPYHQLPNFSRRDHFIDRELQIQPFYVLTQWQEGKARASVARAAARRIRLQRVKNLTARRLVCRFVCFLAPPINASAILISLPFVLGRTFYHRAQHDSRYVSVTKTGAKHAGSKKLVTMIESLCRAGER